MHGIHFRDELPEPVARELDAMLSKLKAFLLAEHNEDGTHNFPVTDTAESSVKNTITQIINEYQARGQWWKKGPWTFDDPNDAIPNRAGLRVPNPTAGTYHNYSPLGIDTAVILELEPDGDITITGLKALEGNVRKRLLMIRNRDNAATVTLKDENTGSLEPYRFDFGGTDVILGPDQAFWMYYDPGRDRWTAALTGLRQGPLSSFSDAQLEITIESDVEIATGPKNFWGRVPFGFTPVAWEIVGDQTGDVEIDIRKDSYANFPAPESADSVIGGSGVKPNISFARKNQSSDLTDWDTDWAKGDRIDISVDSVSTFTKIVLTIYGTRTS